MSDVKDVNGTDVKDMSVEVQRSAWTAWGRAAREVQAARDRLAVEQEVGAQTIAPLRATLDKELAEAEGRIRDARATIALYEGRVRTAEAALTAEQDRVAARVQAVRDEISAAEQRETDAQRTLGLA